MQKPTLTPNTVPLHYFMRSHTKLDRFGRTFTEMMLEFGDVIRFHPFTKFYLVNDLEAIQDILLTKMTSFLKTDRFHGCMRRGFGNGLVTNVHDWAPRRSHYQPHFHGRVLQKAAPLILEHAHKRFDQWQACYSQGPVDMAQELLELVYNSSSHVLFGEDLSRQAQMIIKNIHFSSQFFVKSVPLPPWLPHPGVMQYYWKRRQLRRYLSTIVAARCQSPREAPQDLLDNFIALQQSSAQHALTAKEVIDECIVFLVTGHETTGSLLAWVWHMLGKHPEHLITLYEEVDRILGKAPMTYQHMAQMPFLRMVLDETLRLYPPIWFFSRKSQGAQQIGAYRIPNGSTVILCPYALHRHPDHWPNPNHFDPYRFTKENKQHRPKLSYIPFGSGPRVCIASNLALFQASMILGTLLQRFKVTPQPTEVEEQFIVTLKPHSPVLAQVEPRP